MADGRCRVAGPTGGRAVGRGHPGDSRGDRLPQSAVKLIACWDRDLQDNPPPLPVHVYKLFFLCRRDGAVQPPRPWRRSTSGGSAWTRCRRCRSAGSTTTRWSGRWPTTVTPRCPPSSISTARPQGHLDPDVHVLAVHDLGGIAVQVGGYRDGLVHPPRGVTEDIAGRGHRELPVLRPRAPDLDGALHLGHLVEFGREGVEIHAVTFMIRRLAEDGDADLRAYPELGGVNGSGERHPVQA